MGRQPVEVVDVPCWLLSDGAFGSVDDILVDMVVPGLSRGVARGTRRRDEVKALFISTLSGHVTVMDRVYWFYK